MNSIISPVFQKYLDEPKQLAAIDCAVKLGINVNWLLAVIYFETAKTFSPSKANHIGSVGLIQFTRDKSGVNYKTINGKKYDLTYLAGLSFEKQMLVVHDYLAEQIRISSKAPQRFIDLYLLVFFPKAVNQANDFVLQTKSLTASLIASQNKIFDLNKDSKIQKQEIEKFFDSYFTKNGFDFSKDVDQRKKLGWLFLAVFFYSLFSFTI